MFRFKNLPTMQEDGSLGESDRWESRSGNEIDRKYFLELSIENGNEASNNKGSKVGFHPPSRS